jgi:phosphoglycolate phosphatase
MLPVVLWDIDGTLIRSRGGRVSVTAFLNALREVGQIEGDLPYPKDAGGKTDQQIALEVLLAAQVAEAHAGEMLLRFGPIYVSMLEAQRELLVGDLRVLPGVEAILRRLQTLGVTQSLLTGNLEPIARLKLACAGLDSYVDCELGAYGSDNRDRTCLVPVTRERFRQRSGLEPTSIVVVGDTPRDIACARAGGAHAVAVATGNYTRPELEAHQPDTVLDDLQDTDAVIDALLRYSKSEQHAPIV